MSQVVGSLSGRHRCRRCLSNRSRSGRLWRLRWPRPRTPRGPPRYPLLLPQIQPISRLFQPFPVSIMHSRGSRSQSDSTGTGITEVDIVVNPAQPGATGRITNSVSPRNSSISTPYVFGRAGSIPVGDTRPPVFLISVQPCNSHPTGSRARWDHLAR